MEHTIIKVVIIIFALLYETCEKIIKVKYAKGAGKHQTSTCPNIPPCSR